MAEQEVDYKNRRVLVTGGTGFIGRHVLREGVAAGVELHNLSPGSALLPGVVHHQVDLMDQKQVVATLKKIQPEGIIHLAARGVAYHSADLSAILQVNTVGLTHLLMAAEQLQKVPALVIASSGFEYAPQNQPIPETAPINPTSAYGVSKAAATFCTRLYAHKMPITILRLFSVYGPDEEEPRLTPYIIGAAQRHQRIELTLGEQIRDYSYVKDTAHAFWLALQTPHQQTGLRILNIGSGQLITLRAFVEKLVSVLNSRGLCPDIKWGAKPYRPDEPMVYAPVVTAMQNQLHWQPTTSLLEGFRSMLQDKHVRF